ncbi:hypothetical protein B4080_6176 [Bacillus cereus]|nr:hypothetical protein B4080_6176 [Bacillus cereus]
MDGVIINIIKTIDNTIKTKFFETVLPLARVINLFIPIPPLIYIKLIYIIPNM